MSITAAYGSALSGLTATARQAEVLSSNVANASTPGAILIDDRVIASADALVAAVRSRAPGDKVTLTYLDQSGTPQTVQVTLGQAQQ